MLTEQVVVGWIIAIIAISLIVWVIITRWQDIKNWFLYSVFHGYWLKKEGYW